MSQREDLLAGARRCLVEKGYAHTTARDIAAASGAHLGSIGYHFGSKDALMGAAVIEATGEWGDIFEKAVRAARPDDVGNRLETLLRTLFASIPEQRELLVASVQAYAQADFEADIRTALVAGTAHARVEFAAMMLGVEAEEVDEEAAAGVGGVAYSILTGFIVQGLLDPDALPSPETAAAGLRVLAGGGAD